MISVTKTVLNPALGASVQGVPAKYATLKQAEAAGLVTPKSLLLNAELTDNAIDAFIEQSVEKNFIVRSANLAEDSSDYSLAGHFWSSGAVTKNRVTETITHAKTENQAVLDALQSTAAPQLILQEYIEHRIGGVLFSPWSFFPDYAYIEYSEQGVKQVVEGMGQSAVLSFDDKYQDPLPLPKSLSYLTAELALLCRKLRQIYDFSVDCEWAYDSQKQRLVVLQVRPQTHLVGPILPYSQALSKEWAESGIDNAISSLDSNSTWQFTALSESLGRLSPLSFSLLRELYTDSLPTLHWLGCKARVVDFMGYAADGTVLVDPALEQVFYKLTLFGGFKRGLQQAKMLDEARLTMSQYDHLAAFSYDVLLGIFRYWLAANISSGGAGRESVDGGFTAESPHAYELAWVANYEIQKPTDLSTWGALSRWGRVLFLFELNKLKRVLKQECTPMVNDQTDQRHSLQQDLSDSNYKLFCTWREYQAGDYQAAKARQHLQAQYALYDYAALSMGLGEIQSLSSSREVEGLLYLLKNNTANKDIPTDCILVAPYFDNRWVNLIRHCKAIVVNRGSRLSHSAIVAREYDVPYYVMPELSLDTLKSGQCVVLGSTGISFTKPN